MTMVLVGKLYRIKLYNRCTIFFSFPEQISKASLQFGQSCLRGQRVLHKRDGWTELLEGTGSAPRASSEAVAASEKRRYLSNNFFSCFPRTCQKNEGGVWWWDIKKSWVDENIRKHHLNKSCLWCNNL